MEKTSNNTSPMYKYLSYILIIVSVSISTSMLTDLPPEYNVAATALLLGGMGALHCISMHKREELLDELEKSVEKFKQASFETSDLQQS